MIDRMTAGYIRGLVEMASSCAAGIGLSAVTSVCLERHRCAADFAAFFELPTERVALLPSDEQLQPVLTEWLGGCAELDTRDRKIAENLVYRLRRCLGTPLRLYRAAEERALLVAMSGDERGCGPFFFMEDLFFAEFESCTVCFLMGNDE